MTPPKIASRKSSRASPIPSPSSTTAHAANGAVAPDPWSSEAPEKPEADDEEAEKEPVPLEEQEGVDDPVRMYLREIGKVVLLSGADEKRLARQMEEAKHIEAIEKTLARRASNRLPTRTRDRSSRSSTQFHDVPQGRAVHLQGTSASRLARSAK